jgi:beta-lactamase class A
MRRVAVDGLGGGALAMQALDLRGIVPRPVVKPVAQRPMIDGLAARRFVTASPSNLIDSPKASLETAMIQAVAGTAAIPEPRDYVGSQPSHATSWSSILAMTMGVLLAAGGLGYAWTHRQSAATPRSQSAATFQAAAPATAAPTATAITATTTPAPVQDTITPILSQFSAKYGAPVGISVINLKTGQTFASNADQVYTSASLYKLFVAESVYRAIDNGKISYSTPVSGTGRNVQDCLNYMIKISDNTCGVGLGSLTGWDRQNDRLHAAGFSHTLLRANDSEQTSAGDVALLLKRLYEGTLLSPNSSQAFIDLLKGQQINNRLPQGLPAGTVIAHKTGDLNALLHDAGIVYTAKGDYVISVMSGPWQDLSNGPAAFAGLSRDVYNAFAAQ